MRLLTIRVDASKVQGEGAYVDWRRLTWGERRDTREQSTQLEGEESVEYLLGFVASHIAGWNWTDDQGQPLPLPQSAADLEKLFVEEIDFLLRTATRALRGELELTPEAVKN